MAMGELLFVVPVMLFVAIMLVVLTLSAPKETTTVSRLRAYGYNLAERPGGDLSQPAYERLLLPVLRGLGAAAYRLTPTGVVESARDKLSKSRTGMSLGLFLFLRLLVGGLVPAVYLLFVFLRGRPGVMEWAIAIFLVYLGWRLPDMWLSLKIDARKTEITRSLPDALDLIVVCVEAGYGLEAAIARVCEATKGPLAEEFNQMLAEVSLGRSRRDAMRAMSERSGSADLQTFIAAILQADQMGVNIATALRVQADAMRVRRRQRAEEAIAKAPVKMLFPLTAFIFPALFIVLLGPAMMKIAAMFSVIVGR